MENLEEIASLLEQSELPAINLGLEKLELHLLNDNNIDLNLVSRLVELYINGFKHSLRCLIIIFKQNLYIDEDLQPQITEFFDVSDFFSKFSHIITKEKTITVEEIGFITILLEKFELTESLSKYGIINIFLEIASECDNSEIVILLLNFFRIYLNIKEISCLGCSNAEKCEHNGEIESNIEDLCAQLLKRKEFDVKVAQSMYQLIIQTSQDMKLTIYDECKKEILNDLHDNVCDEYILLLFLDIVDEDESIANEITNFLTENTWVISRNGSNIYMKLQLIVQLAKHNTNITIYEVMNKLFVEFIQAEYRSKIESVDVLNELFHICSEKITELVDAVVMEDVLNTLFHLFCNEKSECVVPITEILQILILNDETKEVAFAAFFEEDPDDDDSDEDEEFIHRQLEIWESMFELEES